MKLYIGIIIVGLLITSCATQSVLPPSPMTQCAELCKGGRVDLFSNDDLQCKCNTVRK